MLFPRIYKIREIPRPPGSDPDGWEKIPPPPNATAEQKRRPWFRTTREWAYEVTPPLPARFFHAEEDVENCALVVGENNEFNGASTGVWFGRMFLGQLNTMESAGGHDGFYTRTEEGGRPCCYLLPMSPSRDALMKNYSAATTAEKNHGAMYIRIKESRRLADDIFFNALRDLNGIPLWRRYLAWLGLRIGGWWAYKRIAGPRQAV